MLEEITLVNLGLGILNACTLVYAVVKLYYMEKYIGTIPSKDEMIKEIVNTKIPFVIGPDGNPMIPDMPQTPKKNLNPIAG